jgi:hypothetical protein
MRSLVVVLFIAVRIWAVEQSHVLPGNQLHTPHSTNHHHMHNTHHNPPTESPPKPAHTARTQPAAQQHEHQHRHQQTDQQRATKRKRKKRQKQKKQQAKAARTASAAPSSSWQGVLQCTWLRTQFLMSIHSAIGGFDEYVTRELCPITAKDLELGLPELRSFLWFRPMAYYGKPNRKYQWTNYGSYRR